jgi:glyoxylase I family protein
MTEISFHHVALTCGSVARTEQFYCDNFGFTRKRAFQIGSGKEIVYISNGLVYLELFPKDTERPIPASEKDGPAYPGLRHIAFKVSDVDAALAAMHDRADISLGPLTFDAFIPGWKSVWIKDPDGNLVELSQGYKDA